MGIPRTIILTLIFLFGCTTIAFGAEVAKIGVVDLQRVLDLSSAGKDANTEVGREHKKLKDQLLVRKEEIDALYTKLDREGVVMSKEMRDKKEREMRIMINDLKRDEKQYEDQLRKLNKAVVLRIQKEVTVLLEEIGKREGYLMIVSKRDGGVIYHRDTIDLTDEFIKYYNAKYAEKKVDSTNQ